MTFVDVFSTASSTTISASFLSFCCEFWVMRRWMMEKQFSAFKLPCSEYTLHRSWCSTCTAVFYDKTFMFNHLYQVKSSSWHHAIQLFCVWLWLGLDGHLHYEHRHHANMVARMSTACNNADIRERDLRIENKIRITMSDLRVYGLTFSHLLIPLNKIIQNQYNSFYSVSYLSLHTIALTP